MLVDVKGKVQNLTLSPNDRLVPLLEAVVNSIQATSKAGADVVVTATRQNTQATLMEEDKKFQQIESFSITDFGTGFNEANYNSFKTADSTYKSKLGCKGVGRFTWLKAFDDVSVESIYLENDSKKRLTFDFSVDDVDFTGASIDSVDEDTVFKTTVYLKNIRSPYRERLPKDLDVVGAEIIEHCLIYFLEGEINSFVLKDNCGNKIDLLSVFQKSYSDDIEEKEFRIGEHSFKAHFFRNNKTNKQKHHKAFFCANSRAVTGYALKEYEDNLPPVFESSCGGKFNYSVYITSNYLDLYVNQERTGFRIALKDNLYQEDYPAIETIILELLLHGRSIFEPHLEPILRKHQYEIESFINNKGYEYKHILKNRPSWLKKIPFNLTDDKLDIELHKLSRDYEVELKEKAVNLRDELKHSKIYDYKAYKDALHEYTEDLNEIGKSNLAKYIVHRKAVIDAFEISLGLQDNDRYALEDAVHDIIMPIRSTSDEVEDHNLWLIDERMAYHKLLASDKPFKAISDINSKERPDLLVFNNPVVYGDQIRETSTAIIVEFKRPMRDDYRSDDNPVDQVLGYVSKLRKPNKIHDDRGRPIFLDKKVPVYCYVICDLTSTIRELLELRGFKPLLDNDGFMFYNENLNSVVEVLSFDKLLRDAQHRNRVLFKKLNLE